MRFAVLSDIHSNWEALQTALGHLEGERIDEWWVLGDTVGYGANPNECFGWMIENADVALLGNHELAVVDPRILEWFNSAARKAVEWTARVLKPEFQEEIRKLNYLHLTPSATMAHGSPDQPEEFRYLFSAADAQLSFRAFKTPLCLVGHTHIPSRFTESSGTVEYLAAGTYPLRKNERYLLNPGSVGQPRDGNPRLSLGIFDDGKWTFELVRLEYDNQKAADKIRKAGLPAYLADRLL